MQTGLSDKVYSPDMQTFSFEERNTLFNVIASVIVGPLRLLVRVTHNIMVLPANLLADYASGLQVVSFIMAAIGVVDLIVFHKWVLLTSQIFMLAISFRLKHKADRGNYKASVKHEVNIDYDEVTEYCEEVYDELDKIMEDSQ